MGSGSEPTRKPIDSGTTAENGIAIPALENTQAVAAALTLARELASGAMGLNQAAILVATLLLGFYVAACVATVKTVPLDFMSTIGRRICVAAIQRAPSRRIIFGLLTRWTDAHPVHLVRSHLRPLFIPFRSSLVLAAFRQLAVPAATVRRALNRSLLMPAWGRFLTNRTAKH